MLAQLRDSRKCTYQNINIILEIQFHFNTNNQPAMNTMVRACLDLLYKPLDPKQTPKATTHTERPGCKN